ncbi:MAG: cytochrome c oxidase subunit II [Methylococcaceae bacterium]|nr:MAG: cytochrome c oxidase subunit II [Methylococcaceae bacterium]
MNKAKRLLAGISLWALGVEAAQAEYKLNLVKGVTETSHTVYGLHMYMLWVCVFIGVVVFGVMFYSILHHRKSQGAVAAHFHENATVEIIWTVIPFLILLSIAIPATSTMIDMADTVDSDMTIKVTGYQWKWRYEYLDEKIDFYSTLDASSNEARQLGAEVDLDKVPNYLLNVDNPLVIPAGKKVRFLFTGADVIHSWWVPAFGWKKDTIPGFVTDGWVKVDKPGVYRGQCTELCGRDHGFMPIVVEVKKEEDYRKWLDDRKQKNVQVKQDAAKTFTKAELMTKGEEVYKSSCAACHQAGGEGVKGTYPPIKGSPVAKGPVGNHVKLVLDGKGQMMPGFGKMLNPVELAAVITYQRNAFGNNVGDLLQPKDIEASR